MKLSLDSLGYCFFGNGNSIDDLNRAAQAHSSCSGSGGFKVLQIFSNFQPCRFESSRPEPLKSNLARRLSPHCKQPMRQKIEVGETEMCLEKVNVSMADGALLEREGKS